MCDITTHGAMELDQNNWVFTELGVHGQSKTCQPGRPFFRIDRAVAESSIRSFEDEKFQSCEAAFVEAMQLHLSTTTVQHEQRCNSSRCTGCEKATDPHTVVLVDRQVESALKGSGDARGNGLTPVREAQMPGQVPEGRTDISAAQARALQRSRSMRASIEKDYSKDISKREVAKAIIQSKRAFDPKEPQLEWHSCEDALKIAMTRVEDGHSLSVNGAPEAGMDNDMMRMLERLQEARHQVQHRAAEEVSRFGEASTTATSALASQSTTLRGD